MQTLNLSSDLKFNIIYDHLSKEQVDKLIQLYMNFYYSRQEISGYHIGWSQSDIDNYLFTHFYSILYFHYNSLSHQQVWLIFNYAYHSQHSHKGTLLNILNAHPINNQIANNILEHLRD